MMHISIICAKVLRTFLKPKTRVCWLQRGKMLSQIISAKVSEHFIQSLHDMCSVIFRICSNLVPRAFLRRRRKALGTRLLLFFILLVNKGQDLHQKGCTCVKIWTLTPNKTIPGQYSVIRCHLRFLDVAISRTNFVSSEGSRNRDSTVFHLPLRKKRAGMNLIEPKEWITIKMNLMGCGWIN